MNISVAQSAASMIHLNIGGKEFCTTVETLTLREPNSMLAAMFSGRHNINRQESEKGCIFIDRDGKHFRHILNWLRDGAVPVIEYGGALELLREAQHFQLEGLIDEIRVKTLGSDLSRIEIIKCAQSHGKVQLQLHGVNLSGVDLSGLDLSGAILTNANLKFANLEGTNLTGANLERIILSGASLIQANLRCAKLGSGNIEMANLTQADLSNADLDSANFKSADLNGAIMDCQTKLSNVNLERANMEGAKIRFGPLMEGADLTMANLQGAIIEVITFKSVPGRPRRIKLPEENIERVILKDLEEVALKYRITLTGTNLTNVDLKYYRCVYV